MFDLSYHINYDYPLVLRTDASELEVGVILLNFLLYNKVHRDLWLVFLKDSLLHLPIGPQLIKKTMIYVETDLILQFIQQNLKKKWDVGFRFYKTSIIKIAHISEHNW